MSNSLGESFGDGGGTEASGRASGPIGRAWRLDCALRLFRQTGALKNVAGGDPATQQDECENIIRRGQRRSRKPHSGCFERPVAARQKRSRSNSGECLTCRRNAGLLCRHQFRFERAFSILVRRGRRPPAEAWGRYVGAASQAVASMQGMADTLDNHAVTPKGS